MSKSKKWWEVNISLSKLSDESRECLAFELLSHYGAGGSHYAGENNLIAHFSGTASDIAQFEQELKLNYPVTYTINEVEDRNWVAESEQVWQPLHEGRLSIIPIAETEFTDPPNNNQIRIYPGTGFGTGHHATTRMLLRIMQSELLAESPPTHILDLGTGSGILAIAAHILFSQRVEACDVDPLAIANAETNLKINHVSENINLCEGGIDLHNGTYDLICANLYAELLIELAESIVTRLNSNAILLVSGILLELWQAVEDRFCSLGLKLSFRLVSSEQFDEGPNDKTWVAAQFEKTRNFAS